MSGRGLIIAKTFTFGARPSRKAEAPFSVTSAARTTERQSQHSRSNHFCVTPTLLYVTAAFFTYIIKNMERPELKVSISDIVNYVITI
ncbi:unnamed protein product [Pieris brassicae]|uniref:Uncharacterized protein n=1 Tax=Pieris brassicae TaxID=7116 RepID=A0A9P0X2Z0_PIEBR|nr:unnamed protein product [Pieris brassicae]